MEHEDFLQQLFDNTKMPVYHLPMAVKADIRPYQYVCIIKNKKFSEIYFLRMVSIG